MPAVGALKPSFKPMNQKFEVNCSSCNVRELCLPGAVCVDDLRRGRKCSLSVRKAS